MWLALLTASCLVRMCRSACAISTPAAAPWGCIRTSQSPRRLSGYDHSAIGWLLVHGCDEGGGASIPWLMPTPQWYPSPSLVGICYTLPPRVDPHSHFVFPWQDGSPVISISIGCSADFAYSEHRPGTGGTRREQTVQLDSGDILYVGYSIP